MVKGAPSLSSWTVESPVRVATCAELAALWRAPCSLEKRPGRSSPFTTPDCLCLSGCGWIEEMFPGQGARVSTAHPECLCLKPKRVVKGPEA